ncbi:MAG: GatB/YqeY domain-containing protein [Planctomycetota bacterium]
MGLWQTIENDLKDAMRNKQELRREVLRMVIAAFKNRRIELGKDLTEADEIAVVQKAVKSREESAVAYTNGGREELAAKERAEIEVLAPYLPKQMDEAATRAAVEALAQELGLSEKKQMGQLMKAVTAKYAGQVDGKLASRIAGEVLS